MVARADARLPGLCRLSQIGAIPERIDDLNMFDISAQAFTGGYRSSEMEEVYMYLFFIVYLLSLGYRRRLRLAGAATA